jgi:hypothetical protein
MGTFVATLLEVKNVGGGIFDVKVNYANAATGQSLDRVYPTSAETYSRTDEFLAFVASEVVKLNAANGVLFEVLGMVGQQIG